MSEYDSWGLYTQKQWEEREIKHQAELRVLRDKMPIYPKDVQFHYCRGKIIRPYPQVLCSLCHSNHGSIDFNAFDEFKRLNIRLQMYEKDSAKLLEKHGVDPSDKVDREDLKRMLNYLIGKNNRLNKILMDIEGWATVDFNERLLKFIRVLKENS